MHTHAKQTKTIKPILYRTGAMDLTKPKVRSRVSSMFQGSETSTSNPSTRTLTWINLSWCMLQKPYKHINQSHIGSALSFQFPD